MSILAKDGYTGKALEELEIQEVAAKALLTYGEEIGMSTVLYPEFGDMKFLKASKEQLLLFLEKAKELYKPCSFWDFYSFLYTISGIIGEALDEKIEGHLSHLDFMIERY